MRRPLHTRMFIGLLVGTLAGLVASQFFADTAALKALLQYVIKPVGQIYLRLLLMLVLPLVFSALVLGITELGDLRKLGRVGAKTFAYSALVSAVAVVLGLFLVNALRPGDGTSPAALEAALGGAADRANMVTQGSAPKTGMELLINIVPDNPLRAAANGDMLAVMFFALLFGVALTLTPTPGVEHLKGFLSGLYDVTLKLINMIIQLAPFGVAALLFGLTAQMGFDAVVPLARYVGVVVLALALHQFVVYSLSVRLLGGMSPVHFFKSISEAMLTAFSTASSNATLPTALKVAEERLKLPPDISRFVLTLGSTANQNGTALFEGVTVLFLAQLYGVELPIAQQVLVLLVCILGGIGTAGVPAGSLPVIAMLLGMVGVPLEGIGFILGVDRILDMCRTTLNVSGDLAAAVVVSHSERGRS